MNKKISPSYTDTITVSHELTLEEHKLWHVLLDHAYPDFHTEGVHAIAIEELIDSGASGSSSHQLLQALRHLSFVIKYNVINAQLKKEVGFFALLTSFHLEDGACFYTYSPMFKNELYKYPSIKQYLASLNLSPRKTPPTLRPFNRPLLFNETQPLSERVALTKQ